MLAALHSKALVLLLAISGAAATVDTPDQDQVLNSMREYASKYVDGLPNFVCQQTTEQFEAGKKGDRWRQLNSFTSKLVFADGREQRTLELVDGRPAQLSGRRASRRPLSTEGEFAILISNIFGESSQADFQWEGWQEVQGARCATFSYRIAREHSTMKLSLSDLASATVPYHGFVFANAETGEIRRVSNEANEIPPEIKTQRIATTIDYAPVAIGASSYLLPSDATVQVATSSGRIRNELHFRNYQKFEAQSTITFGSDDPSAPKTPPQSQP